LKCVGEELEREVAVRQSNSILTEAALDRVDRYTLWKVLKMLGVKEQVVRRWKIREDI